MHVRDIADAHLLCLEHIDTMEPAAFNLGQRRRLFEPAGDCSRGAGNGPRHPRARRTTAARRSSAPGRIAERIARSLGWQPAIPDLDTMVESAWKWHLNGQAAEPRLQAS